MTYDSSLDLYVEDYDIDMTDDEFKAHCRDKFNQVHDDELADFREHLEYIDDDGRPCPSTLHQVAFFEYLNGETGCGYDWTGVHADQDGTYWYIVYCGDGYFTVVHGPTPPPHHTVEVPPAHTCRMPSGGDAWRKLYDHQKSIYPGDSLQWCDGSGTPVISFGQVFVNATWDGLNRTDTPFTSTEEVWED